MNRRNFLKIVSFGGTLALAGKMTFDAAGENKTGKPVSQKRWAMVIDIRKCEQNENCTQCIKACNKAHNIPKINNPKDEVKWIWKDKFDRAFLTQENPYLPRGLNHQAVLLLCNHCDNPPCTNVCPTKATWKREDGLVMMDWHRCVGCRYCVAACPYGSRSFNWKDPRPFIQGQHSDFPTRMKGVVEKCTFCDERISRGRIPACVEACQAKAMAFGNLNDPDSDVRKLLSENFSIRRKPELGTSPEVYYLV
jgi:molybdopterin-containing oxidoreductase family iron-sulfur binding subunit